ncbi:cysteine desulfurase [Flavobacterium sp. J372]|uniref:cysteine desulfurase family protein n=1 Tax=Flavobacterium sp. J372 TaxID=2898436 RepID=UPI002151FB07|nr:cysteine desulfurase family protein [Flavobacterium sp. J372]MCR5862632.1 cysteine desulfurase [Flavobacterium sp. J372]
MKRVYLDNASTTALRPEVIAEMTEVMASAYGNPSSTHSFGRSAKTIVEASRKKIAALVGADAGEIIFTSGGTEADSWVIQSAVRNLGVKRIITSRAEHHAVLNTVALVAGEFSTQVNMVRLDSKGQPELSHLEALLSDNIPTLVSLMHINNETGVVLDLQAVGNLCRQYNALFHTDTVQTFGKEKISFKDLPVDFAAASAHKFHGPKGVGFAFIRKGLGIQPIIAGGEQEKGLRAGTEAVHQIAGMAKALELSYINLDIERQHISNLKGYLFEQLDNHFPGYKVNGTDKGVGHEMLFYNIANVMLPLPEEKTSMILFQLDMKGVAVSRGSACQSGSIKPSHVLQEILCDDDLKKPSLRISFSHYNTKEDIDLLIEALKTI